MQDINLTQIKLKVNCTYKENEKVTRNFTSFHDEEMMKKPYLDTNLPKVGGHLSLVVNDCNDFKLRIDKHSEKVSIEKAVKTNIQKLCDKGIFDNFNNTDELLNDF